jgi:hypothetical protein
MAYTTINFKKKRELIQAVEAKRNIMIYSPGMGPDYTRFTGKATVEGPHYPAPHTWYAEVWLENGIVVRVR